MDKFSPSVNNPLEVLEDKSGTSIFIGRTKSIHKKYGRDGSLLLGKLVEDEGFGKNVYLDAMTPHVIFISGARGSGKSYSLGVIAEELNSKNPNVAVVIIDPVGIFWSMKYPNQEEKEINEVMRLGLTPKGVKNVNVFIPYGVRKTLPKETYDKTYALRPADLTVDDWCLTFDIDRFSPTGLMLEKVLEKVRNGYSDENKKKVKAKDELFSIDDIINCMENDAELTSKDKGYKKETRRAIGSRFEAAKSWGIFKKDGTPLTELCKEGSVSVIDVSFLDEKVTALVIGILSRKILNARKLATRQTAMKRLAVTMDNVLNTNIPPTWLFIDEAHTLIPSGGAKTAASDALIEYVKQGRRPGCSLVFATQQPSAIDTRVLSQIDILMCHKLVFDDDLKAVFKRMPTMIPKEYERSRFVKTLPIGTCLVGDRSDFTSRAFTIKIRPRFSQHEGRETRSIEFEEGLTEEQIKNSLMKMIVDELKEHGQVAVQKVGRLVKTINSRYKTKIEVDNLLEEIEDKGHFIDDDLILLEMPEEEVEELSEDEVEDDVEEELDEDEHEEDEVLCIAAKFSKSKANSLIKKKQKRKFLGFFGTEESLKYSRLELHPIYKVDYDYFEKKGFKKSTCFVDGMTGEILYVKGDKLLSTQGAGLLAELSPNKRKVISALKKGKEASARGIAGVIEVTETTARNNCRELVEEGLIKEKTDGHATLYSLKDKIKLPHKINTAEFTTVENVFVMTNTQGIVIAPRVSEESIEDFPNIFGETKVRDISLIYRPVYHARFESTKGHRNLFIDAMTGKIMK